MKGFQKAATNAGAAGGSSAGSVGFGKQKGGCLKGVLAVSGSDLSAHENDVGNAEANGDQRE